MDWLYDHLFVRPMVWLAQIDRNDIVDSFYDGVALISQAFYRGLRTTETGRVRWYAAGIVLGSIIFVAIVLFA
jgi:NADH-quinone oxidoreductase subunit L